MEGTVSAKKKHNILIIQGVCFTATDKKSKICQNFVDPCNAVEDEGPSDVLMLLAD